ncbi:MAG TPA: hypothetical protein VGG94_03640 [Chthoniobacterales bacterium]
MTWNAVGSKSYIVQASTPPVDSRSIGNFSDFSEIITVPGNMESHER